MFANLPPGQKSVNGGLEKLRFALEELGADGNPIIISYGEGSEAKYLGLDLFASIGQAFHNRKAIIFLHGD